MKRSLLLATLLMASWLTADAQIYRVAQMNTDQIRALDKQKTVVYSSRMTGNEQMRAGLADSTKNELERERRQREWMKKKGIE